MKIIIAGAGPAGVFAAITAARANPQAAVVVVERTETFLHKLSISGSGKGNLTVAEHAPDALAAAYPRGGQELLGPLHQWGSRETADWFQEQGVPLKTDADGGVGPVSERARDLSECLLRVVASLPNITFITNRCVLETRPTFEGGYRLWFKDGEPMECDRLLLTTGGAGKGFGIAEELGHTIIPGKPSLFNFHTNDVRLRNLQGIEVEKACAWLPQYNLEASGPISILPKGLGGKCIARLSSPAALELAAREYKFRVQVNWVYGLGGGQPTRHLQQVKLEHPRRSVLAEPLFDLPQKLWARLAEAAGMNEESRWGTLSNRELQTFAGQLASSEFIIKGHSMHKPEWVTAGGVALDEVDFKSMRSKLKPNLWLAGELLNIDGLPGGYNFQAAWTTGFLAGRSIAQVE